MAIERTIGLPVEFAGCIGRHDRFAAEDASNAKGLAGRAWRRVVFAQTVSNLCQQGVVSDLREVCNFQLVRQALAAGRARGNEQGFVATRPGSHGSFGVDLITGVNDAVYLRALQDGWPIAWLHEFLNTMHVAGGVNTGNTLAHGLHLGLTHRGIECVNLPVDVGFGNVVQVDQRKAPNAAARQCFGCPGADAADTDNGDVSLGDTGGSRRTVEAIKSTKPAPQVCSCVSGTDRADRLGAHFIRASRSLAVAAASEAG
mgnify:FL=1